MVTGGSMSVRTKRMPVSTGAGRKVRKTFSPLCKPTPVARMAFFSVLCRGPLVIETTIPMTVFGLSVLLDPLPVIGTERSADLSSACAMAARYKQVIHASSMAANFRFVTIYLHVGYLNPSPEFR
jgi:hypothetical protein